MKSDPLSETRLTDQQNRFNQTLFPQTFVEHFHNTHLIVASLMKTVGIIGPDRYNQAELTRDDLTQANLTQGRVDPHSLHHAVPGLSLFCSQDGHHWYKLIK